MFLFRLLYIYNIRICGLIRHRIIQIKPDHTIFDRSIVIPLSSNTIHCLLYFFLEWIEVFQLGIFLGFNLISALTKLRCYRCKGDAMIKINDKFLIVTAVVVIILSSSVTLSFIACDTLPYLHVDFVKCNFEFHVPAAMFYYNACGVLPTLGMFATLLFIAYNYFANSQLSDVDALQKRVSSPKRQLKAIQNSSLIYLISFFFLWTPFAVFKILSALKSGQSFFAYKYFALCFKLGYFSFHPATDGIVGKRQRKNLKAMMMRRSLQLSSRTQRYNFKAKCISMDSLTPRRIPLTSSPGSFSLSRSVRSINAKDNMEESYRTESKLFSRRGKKDLPSIDMSNLLSSKENMPPFTKSPKRKDYNSNEDLYLQFTGGPFIDDLSASTLESDNLSTSQYFTPNSCTMETSEYRPRSATCSCHQILKQDVTMKHKHGSVYFSSDSLFQTDLSRHGSTCRCCFLTPISSPGSKTKFSFDHF